MVAVTTTVQGFVVAAYAAILERDYRERYAAAADDTLAGLQNGALRASGRPRDVVDGFAAALDSFAQRLGDVLADLGRDLPEEVRKGVEQASQALAGVLTTPLDNSVNALGGRVGEIGNVVMALDATIAAAGQRIAVGVEAVQRSAKSPQEFADVMSSAVMALEAARAALETAGDTSNRATEGLAAMADRVAAAVAAVRVSGAIDNASRVREIETRFAALCEQLERMLNAVSELSKQTLVGGFPPEPTAFAARMG
jgi:methyl-accepting chemotaxis protein